MGTEKFRPVCRGLCADGSNADLFGLALDAKAEGTQFEAAPRRLVIPGEAGR